MADKKTKPETVAERYSRHLREKAKAKAKVDGKANTARRATGPPIHGGGTGGRPGG